MAGQTYLEPYTPTLFDQIGNFWSGLQSNLNRSMNFGTGPGQIISQQFATPAYAAEVGVPNPQPSQIIPQARQPVDPYAAVRGQGVTPAQTPNPTPQPTTQAYNPPPSGGDLWSQISPFYQGWDRAHALADYSQAFGGDINRLMRSRGYKTQADLDYENAISDAYQPALNALGELEAGVRANKEESLVNVGKTAEEGTQKVKGEEAELLANLTQQQSELDQGQTSALSEAVRYYNSLKQQTQSRYGQGSSTGPAIQELALQEFLRNEGKIRGSYAEGQSNLAGQQVQMKNYVSNKLTEVEAWKREALAQINQNFTQQISQIGMRRGEVEANKTNAKLQALQLAKSQAQQIAQAEESYKRQLAMWGVEQAQKFAQRAFTPQGIVNVYNNIASSQLQGFTNQRINPIPQVSFGRASTEDELRRAGLL